MPAEKTDLVRLTPSENEFIAELIKGKRGDMSIVIPDDMEPREVLVAVRDCVSTLNKLDKAEGFIVAALGRLMALASKNPEIYEKAGYDSLKDFEEGEIASKVKHASLWNAKRAYEVFPELPLEKHAEIGTTNLNLASKHAKGKSERQKKEIIDKAAELAPAKFQDWIEGESGLSAPGENQGATYLLTGSKAELDEFQVWMKDPRFEQAAEATTPIGKILAAIHSFSTEWNPESDNPMQPAVAHVASEDDKEW